MGIAERYDIVIDFSQYRVGDKLHLVNLAEHHGRARTAEADGSVARRGAVRQVARSLRRPVPRVPRRPRSRRRPTEPACRRR